MATSIETSREDLLRDLLRHASRLFYTTLAVVPAEVRDQVSLAYLVARTADTIADTGANEPKRSVICENTSISLLSSLDSSPRTA